VSGHPTLVQDFLRRSAARLPDKVALVCDGRRWTYAELDRATNRLAQGLRARGVRRGDRVALCLPNSADAVLGIFAVMKAGAVFVMLNPTTKREKLAYVLRDCAASALWVDAGAVERGAVPDPSEMTSVRFTVVCGGGAEQAAGRLREGLAREGLETGLPETPPETPRVDLDLACLIYTSGSTGEPKGVISDHSNMVFAASSIIEYLRNVERDVVLSVLPLSFDYGL